jgi:beta-lactamase class D
MRESANWYFEELLRRLDPQATARAVRELGYGNQQVGDDPLRFWVDGDLRISALEQTDFWARLWSGALPIGASSRGVLADILRLEADDGRVLYGKTGTAQGPAQTISWLVGVADLRGHRLAYATLMRAPAAETDALLRERLAITRALLAQEAP